MTVARSVVVLVVKPGSSARRSTRLVRWLRWLLPAALLIVSQKPLFPPGADDVMTLDADAVESGPLAVADAIVKARELRR
jgi:hypothetical protein